jgi:hypothetical protein
MGKDGAVMGAPAPAQGPNRLLTIEEWHQRFGRGPRSSSIANRMASGSKLAR